MIRRATRLAVLLAVLAALALRSARAATVEVVVSEQGGGPIAGQPVLLLAAGPEARLDVAARYRAPAGRCTTGLSGRCTIDHLAPGVYSADLREIVDPNMCAPSERAATVTLTDGGSKAELRVELRRGARVQLSLRAAGGGTPPRAAVSLWSDSLEREMTEIDASGRGQITLPPGRWSATLVGVPAGLVSSIERDGEPVDVLEVPFELTVPSPDRFITWTLDEPCMIRGHVTSDHAPPGVGIEANLVHAGAWGSSPFCRSGACGRPRRAAVLPDGSYSLSLPCGTWRVAPYGSTLLESTPPVADVTASPGLIAGADFRVLEKDAAGGDRDVTLSVRVAGPGGRPLPASAVELWPRDGIAGQGKAIDRQSTGDRGEPAKFFVAIEDGQLIRVRVPGLRTAVQRVPGPTAAEGEPRRTVVTLRRGGSIDALAKDPDGKPVRSVGLVVRRIEHAAESTDPEVALAADEVEIKVPPGNDQTGHVVATGLAAGRYVVRPTAVGELGAGAKLSIHRAASGPAEETEVEIKGEERVDLFVSLRPAVSLAGRLVCDDGGRMPALAEVCLLGVPSSDERLQETGPCARSLLPSHLRPLSGVARTSFRVGPLDPGTFRLGLRPAGYSGWTWALGTPDPTQAALLEVAEAEAVDVGDVRVLCGPAISIVPSVASKEPLPDISDGAVEATLTRPLKGGKLETLRPKVELDSSRAILRELPEGEWTLSLTMSHRYFLPAAPMRMTVPVQLVRGRFEVVRPHVEAIGGVITVAGVLSGVRLTTPKGEQSFTPARNGRVEFSNLPPGLYGLEACEDAACGKVSESWAEIRVTAGRPTIVSPRTH